MKVRVSLPESFSFSTSLFLAWSHPPPGTLRDAFPRARRVLTVLLTLCGIVSPLPLAQIQRRDSFLGVSLINLRLNFSNIPFQGLVGRRPLPPRRLFPEEKPPSFFSTVIRGIRENLSNLNFFRPLNCSCFNYTPLCPPVFSVFSALSPALVVAVYSLTFLCRQIPPSLVTPNSTFDRKRSTFALLFFFFPKPFRDASVSSAGLVLTSQFLDSSPNSGQMRFLGFPSRWSPLPRNVGILSPFPSHFYPCSLNVPLPPPEIF